MKKGKITDVEVSCLKGMLLDNISEEDMARQLGRTTSFVKKELAVIQKAVERASLFINETASGEKGVSIMTPLASTKIDENKSKQSTIPPQSERKTWVHKLRDNG